MVYDDFKNEKDFPILLEYIVVPSLGHHNVETRNKSFDIWK